MPEDFPRRKIARALRDKVSKRVARGKRKVKPIIRKPQVHRRGHGHVKRENR